MLRVLRSRALRVGFLLLVVALLGYALATQWPDIRPRLHQLSVAELVGGEAAVLVGLWTSLLAWRALLADLGSPLPVQDALRIVFVGQLGKYLPGSVWPVLAQMELGAERGVPRVRSGAASIVVMGVTVATGGLVGLVALPFLLSGASGGGERAWVLLVVPVGLALLHPRVVNPVLGRALRLLRRPPLEHPLTARGLLTCGLWSLGTWAAFGLQAYLLARGVGGHGARLLAVAVGGYALAWVSGFLVVFAPAGAGARELVLVLVLGGLTGHAGAVTVAVVSRLLFSVGDLLTGGYAAASIGRARLRTLRARTRAAGEPASGPAVEAGQPR